MEAKQRLSGNKGALSALAAKFKGGRAFALAIIGAAAGLALLLIPSSGGKSEQTDAAAAYTARDYCAELERKAEELINALPDVKNCRVVITLETGYKYVYATDQHLKEDDGGARQSDKTVVLADAPGGGKNALTVNETMPAVAGVAVVVRGAGYETKYRVIELMCALFNVKSNRISVQG